MGYQGEVVYIFAFDVAYEMIREPGPTLLGQPVVEFEAEISRHHPEQLLFYRPKMIRMPVVERTGPHGTVPVRRTLKLYSVGAVSVTVRIPFDVERIEDLVRYHDIRFNTGTLAAEAKELAESVRSELRSCYRRPLAKLLDEEAYTVFCIGSALKGPDGAAVQGVEWLKEQRKGVSALLTQEAGAKLSEQLVERVCGRSLSYYERDITVVDWDAALVVDDPRNFDETLHIMELANVELGQLEAYDALLDSALDRAYRDVGEANWLGRGGVINELREIRIDLARLSDELENITKFFGEWHLARLYKQISECYHLDDWNRTIDQKLRTLQELYELLKHERENRWMLILEVMIVVLFVADIALILLKQEY